VARFTIENARSMSARAWQLRRERAAAALLAPPPSPDQPSEQPEEHAAKRLACIRHHVGRLSDMLAKARDPLDCDRLARALSTLLERERIAEGTPLPGQLKPKLKVARTGEVEPI
jgi:hypothetical protein